MSRSVFVNVVNVTGNNGLLGTAELTVPPEGREHSETILLTLPDGRTVFVPRSLLVQRPDGTYRLPLDAGDLKVIGGAPPPDQEQQPEQQQEPLHEHNEHQAQEHPSEQPQEPAAEHPQETQPNEAVEQAVIPVLEERYHIDKRMRDVGVVRVRKLIREHEETVEVPLVQQLVDVQRTPVEQFIDAPPPVRQEGDVIVVPVVEEVLVVEKRLMLREELRITKRTVTETATHHVKVWSEEPIIERETIPDQ